MCDKRGQTDTNVKVPLLCVIKEVKLIQTLKSPCYVIEDQLLTAIQGNEPNPVQFLPVVQDQSSVN